MSPARPTSSGFDRLPQAEALPDDFDQNQVEVDRLLRSMLSQRKAMPSGLAERVFALSAPLLPHESDAASPLRLVGADEAGSFGAQRDRRMVLPTGAWARFALAASVLLVASIAIIMPRSEPVRENTRIAGNEPRATAVALELPQVDEFGEIDDFNGEVAYLLDASEMHSLNDLSSDLALLVSQLEM